MFCELMSKFISPNSIFILFSIVNNAVSFFAMQSTFGVFTWL